MKLRHIITVLRKTIDQWGTSQVVRLAAAIAYYAASSLLSLLVITAFAGSLFVFGEENFRSEIISGIQPIIGENNAQVIDDALQNSSSDIRQSSPAAAIGIILVLIYSASRMFRRLRDALNVLWGAESNARQSSGVISYLRDTIISLAAAIFFGILLLLVLLLNGVAFALVNVLDRLLPDGNLISVWQVAGFVLLFLVMTLVFAFVYRFMPQIHLEWRDVLIGGAVTALLFTIGQFGIAAYIDLTNTGTVFGVVGSFIVILLWVYISAYIVLFGAIFTHTYAVNAGEQSA